MGTYRQPTTTQATANALCSGMIFARASFFPRNVQRVVVIVGMSGNQFLHHFTVHVGEAKIRLAWR